MITDNRAQITVAHFNLSVDRIKPLIIISAFLAWFHSKSKSVSDINFKFFDTNKKFWTSLADPLAW